MSSDPAEKGTDEQVRIPDELPILPLRDMVVYPFIIAPLSVAREISIQAVDRALAENRMILLTAQRDKNEDEPDEAGLFHTGTVAVIGLKKEHGAVGHEVASRLPGPVEGIQIGSLFHLNVGSVVPYRHLLDTAGTAGPGRQLQAPIQQTVVGLSRPLEIPRLMRTNQLHHVGRCHVGGRRDDSGSA